MSCNHDWRYYDPRGYYYCFNCNVTRLPSQMDMTDAEVRAEDEAYTQALMESERLSGFKPTKFNRRKGIYE